MYSLDLSHQSDLCFYILEIRLYLKGVIPASPSPSLSSSTGATMGTQDVLQSLAKTFYILLDSSEKSIVAKITEYYGEPRSITMYVVNPHRRSSILKITAKKPL